ncbi:MAG TPA: YegS/Rv2252/BmrU family lipid kinase [Chitinophagaceae bacterium]|nr:YegS/Rv2252/BmrU family lipid kinase [Chitinophagaceae bacterium]
MHRHIIYIINEKAGTRTKKDLRSFIEQKTREHGILFDSFLSVADGNYSFLNPIIEEKKTTDIVIAGGDGTVNQVINSLKSYDVNFGIIPCGSGNGLAFSAKIPKKPAKALDTIFKGNASAVDAFTINDHFSCMLSGIGFDAKVAHDFAKQPERGLTTYIKQIIKNFFSAKTYLFEIQLANHSFTVEAFFISIANSNQFGNNFTIAPVARLDDGLLDIVIVTKQNKLSFLLKTLMQVKGRNKIQTEISAKKGVVYFQTDQLDIHNKSLAPLHIDGDPAGTSEKFTIQIKKKCFRLLQP